jgi:hypothetical protein
MTAPPTSGPAGDGLFGGVSSLAPWTSRGHLGGVPGQYTFVRDWLTRALPGLMADECATHTTVPAGHPVGPRGQTIDTPRRPPCVVR